VPVHYLAITSKNDITKNVVSLGSRIFVMSQFQTCVNFGIMCDV